MRLEKKHIVVFEHQTVLLNQKFEGDVVFEQSDLEAFETFHGNGVPYFKLIRNGIQFTEYVGAIKVGNMLVEVLPKADKRPVNSEQQKRWQQILIDMLRVVHGFEVKAPSSSDLSLKNNSVLDLYFELFISEVELLLHQGLVKKYRQTEGNLNSLKGKLLFNQQINKNLVHKERFYTKFTTYDTEHLLHIILHETLHVLRRINTNATIVHRINSLSLSFPEMPRMKVLEATFEKIEFNRKTVGYKRAIDIARLILLHFHPDLSKGSRDVLALMFDMNLLWEEFVLVSLKRSKDLKVHGQNFKFFWKPNGGKRRTIRPDIRLRIADTNFIIDTKWKLIDRNPSVEDVRQMYAYHIYFNAKKVALLYPGETNYISGKFVDIEKQHKLTDMECGLMFTSITGSIKDWQSNLIAQVHNWIGSEIGSES